MKFPTPNSSALAPLRCLALCITCITLATAVRADSSDLALEVSSPEELQAALHGSWYASSQFGDVVLFISVNFDNYEFTKQLKALLPDDSFTPRNTVDYAGQVEYLSENVIVADFYGLADQLDGASRAAAELEMPVPVIAPIYFVDFEGPGTFVGSFGMSLDEKYYFRAALEHRYYRDKVRAESSGREWVAEKHSREESPSDFNARFVAFIKNETDIAARFPDWYEQTVRMSDKFESADKTLEP